MIKPVHPIVTMVLLTGSLLLMMSSYAASTGDSTNSCIECHQDKKFFVQNKKIYQYFQDWQDSPHQHAGLVCNDCHGGNPKGITKAAAHAGTLSPSSSMSRVFFKNQPETCGECHEKESVQFSRSDHFKGLMDSANAPTCSTCHRTMNRKPYFTTIVEATCQVCHYEGNKDELPLVAEKVHRILNRLNSAKGYLNWTSVYFREKNWPGDSKAEVKSLQSAYREILAAGHSFDLSIPDESSIELLTRLKRIYQETADDSHRHTDKP